MTQKHKRPTAPASKKLPKKAAKPAAAAKPLHPAKTKQAEKHVEAKKPLAKVKAPEKAAAPAPEAKGKVVELKAAQKLAAARAAANAAAAAAAPADGKTKGRKGAAELINLPARRSVLDDAKFKALTDVNTLAAELPDAAFPPAAPGIGDVTLLFYTAFNEAVLGKKSPKQALDDGVAKAD